MIIFITTIWYSSANEVGNNTFTRVLQYSSLEIQSTCAESCPHWHRTSECWHMIKKRSCNLAKEIQVYADNRNRRQSCNVGPLD